MVPDRSGPIRREVMLKRSLPRISSWEVLPGVRLIQAVSAILPVADHLRGTAALGATVVALRCNWAAPGFRAAS